LKVSLNNLIELQNLDAELEKLEALKGDLPQQIEKLKDELKDVEIRHEDLKRHLDESTKMKTESEGELQTLQEKLKKYQDQLYQVTSNREYDAITLETDTIKEKIDALEGLIIDFLQKEETLSAEAETLHSELVTLRESIAGKEEILLQKIKDMEKDVNKCSKKRDQVAALIKSPVLYQYERIRKGVGNTAVVGIQKYSCSGCFSTIPPQKAVEIKMMNQLILCESCGRILVFNGKHDPVAA